MQEKVGIIGFNSEEYIHTIIKMWDRGQVPALIDYRIPAQKIINIMKNTGIRKAYVDENIVPIFSKQEDIAIRVFRGERKREYVLSDSIKEEYKKANKNGDGIILFSSGTTGKNKGILLTHNAMSGNAEAIMDYMEISAKDTIYIMKSLNHSSTFIGELLVGLKSQANVVLSSHIFSAKWLLETLDRHNTTIICLNATILSLLIDTYKNISDKKKLSIRKIYVSGEMCSEKLILDARETFERCEIYNMYGLTEAGPRVTAQCTKGKYKNSCGFPIKGVEVQICDEQGNIKNNGERGLVYVKTPYKMKGYIQDGKTELLTDEWINTKDVGFLDDNGELFIIGRSDNMITVSGHNIFPEEIEKVANKHPLVQACAVFRETINPTNSELKCYVELKRTNYKINESKLRKELRKLFQQELTSYEIPSQYLFIEKIPRTVNGKIARNKLKKIGSVDDFLDRLNN